MALRKLKFETAMTNFLRVGIKWDALSRDEMNEFYQLRSAAEAKRLSDNALKKANQYQLMAKLAHASYFFRHLDGKYENLRDESLKVKKTMDDFIAQDGLHSFDLDLCCFCYGKDGEFIDFVAPVDNMVTHLSTTHLAIAHSGDDDTGTGDMFDELFMVNVKLIDPSIHHLFFIAVSFNHPFIEVRNFSWAIVSSKSEKTMLSARPQGDGKVHVMAKLSRQGDTAWMMEEVQEFAVLDEKPHPHLHLQIDQLLKDKYLKQSG